MALSITNPLSSIHIDPNFRFYKLSIEKKKIVHCDDKQILNYFRELSYLHCSLCLLQEKDSHSIYEHLTSESHALNGMRSKNFVGFLIEEISGLVICPREHINYLFYLKYKNFPYKSCLGVADDRFVTVVNKPFDKVLRLPEEYEFSAVLGDFDLKPENIGTRLSLTAMIEFGRNKDELFPQNFLLYELKYTLIDYIKYELKTGNIWNYLKRNTITPRSVICSCSKEYTPSLFMEHLPSSKCTMEAAIYCHLCKTLCIFSSASFLTHTHNSEIDVNNFLESNTKIDKFNLKKLEKCRMQNVNVTHKVGSGNRKKLKNVNVKDSSELVNKKMFVKKHPKKCMEPVILSKNILGEFKQDTAQYKRLCDKFKVYFYHLTGKEPKIYQVNEIPKNYNLTFLLCCSCEKICQSNIEIMNHLKGASHASRMVVCPPVAIYFPDIKGLVIGNLEDFNYFQHIFFTEKSMYNNIIVGDSETLVMIFYNFGNILHRLPSKHYSKIDNIKTSLGHDNNYKLKCSQLILNSNNASKQVYDRFIVFECFNKEEEESEEFTNVNNIDQFLLSLKIYTSSCSPCGLKMIKFNDLSNHISTIHCHEKCVGFICQKCLTFSIHSFQRCLRHYHNDLSLRHERIKQHEGIIEHVKSGEVRKVDIALLENIDIKEYFDTVNLVRSSIEISHIKSLSNYLLNALPLRCSISNVDFLCNICENLSLYRIKEIADHIVYHMKFRQGYGGLCDICLQFLYGDNPNILEDHIKSKHSGYIKQENDFQIKQNENGITINILASFSYNLLESYVEKLTDYLKFICQDIIVFCMVCFKTFVYSLENIQSHLMAYIHQPKTNDSFSAYCRFCKLLFFNDDIRWIANHFNYHSHLIKINLNIIDETNAITSIVYKQKEIAVLKELVLFSCCIGRGKFNQLVLSEFEYKRNVEISTMYKNLNNTFNKNENNFQFKCLNCSVDCYNENDCNAHFLTDFHSLEHNVDVYLVAVCRACSIILISLSPKLLSDHFDSGSHFMNAVLEDINASKKELKLMEDSDRHILGYLTKNCEEIFTSKENYDKFLEDIIIELKRAERGLLNICTSLTNDIKLILSGTYPEATVNFFGSRISGLAKIKSDIDIYIDFGSTDLQSIVPLFKIIPGLFLIKQVILGAKVPIIKLEHKNTGLNCDICCRDGHGIQNTLLVKLYLNLDERVYRLCITVLEWAKINGIRGTPKFTSYALTWMVLFFLMQPEINVVPSVKWLQDHYCGQPVVINGWNCSFLNDINRIDELFLSTSNKEITLYELIYKFFNYFGSLQADSFILFPNTGELISTNWLLKNTADKVPLNFRNIFFDNNGDKVAFAKGTSFIVMDPFILNNNVVPNLRKHDLKLFQSLCVHTGRCLEWVYQKS